MLNGFFSVEIENLDLQGEIKKNSKHHRHPLIDKKTHTRNVETE